MKVKKIETDEYECEVCGYKSQNETSIKLCEKNHAKEGCQHLETQLEFWNESIVVDCVVCGKEVKQYYLDEYYTNQEFCQIIVDWVEKRGLPQALDKHPDGG